MKELFKEEELEPFLKMGFSREIAIHIAVQGKKELGDGYDMVVGARLYFKPEQPKLTSATIEGNNYDWWEFNTEGVRNSISINRLNDTANALRYFDPNSPNVELAENFQSRKILMVPKNTDDAIKFIQEHCFDMTIEVVGVAKHCGTYDKTYYLFEIVA